MMFRVGYVSLFLCKYIYIYDTYIYIYIILIYLFIYLYIYTDTLYYMKNCSQCAIFWVPKMNKTPGSK